jgi:hypothetical protein
MPSFYAQLSEVSLTVLGLWLVVVQLRHDDLVGQPGFRRQATGVSLTLGVPGLLGLLSLVDTESPGLWQTAFALGAGLGALGIVVVLWARPILVWAPLPFAGLAVAAGLQAAIAAVAVVAAADTGREVLEDPLVVEGVLLALLLAVGLVVAWSLAFPAGRRRATGDVGLPPDTRP